MIDCSIQNWIGLWKKHRFMFSTHVNDQSFMFMCYLNMQLENLKDVHKFYRQVQSRQTREAFLSGNT